MFKKFWYAFFAVLLLAALTIGVVSAKAQTGGKFLPESREHHRLLIGQVVRLGANDFDLQAPNGDVHTVQVTDGTAFRTRSGEGIIDTQASFEDLSLDSWVGILNRPESEEGMVARLVVILPEDFDPANLKGVRAIGEVTQVNNGQGTFEILSRAGETVAFGVDENTRYGGLFSGFEDLEKGLNVVVLAWEQEDGTLLAKLVGARNLEDIRFDKTGGKITAIGSSSLTILSRQQEERTFIVTDETRFFSRDNMAQSLDDLQVGLPVIIMIEKDGSPDEAAGVVVLDEAILNLERVRGEVQSAGGSHLTLSVDGETFNFTVDENTRIRGRGIEDLNDLKNGMKAGVLYLEQEDGTLLAKGILVAPGEFPGQ
ncbi:MAG: DUF5666 domain-containing protein [Anaerolineales bacterium]